MIFLFNQKTAYEMVRSDWSSDVCSSDLSAALAEVVSQASGIPVARDALKRRKSTPQQVGLSVSERALNVQGAFAVPARGRAEVVGRRLILIDDVLTSGATVDACSRALLRAGAAA